MDDWFTYMIECSDGSIYTGITTNVAKRMKQHNTGKGAKYTKKRNPVILKALWGGKTRSEASKLEHSIKQFTREDKLELIDDESKLTLIFGMGRKPSLKN